jgi:hypothetical protein
MLNVGSVYTDSRLRTDFRSFLVPATILAFFWFFDLRILCHPPRLIIIRLSGFNGTDQQYISYLERLVSSLFLKCTCGAVYSTFGQVPSSMTNAPLQAILNNSAPVVLQSAFTSSQLALLSPLKSPLTSLYASKSASREISLEVCGTASNHAPPKAKPVQPTKGGQVLRLAYHPNSKPSTTDPKWKVEAIIMLAKVPTCSEGD